MDLFSKCKELYEKIRYFEYGIPVDGVIKPVPSAEYYVKNYHFLKPEEFEKYKGGICWDYVEYERKFLEVNDIDFNQYYLITNTPPNYDTHTFITVKDGDELIYIESSFKRVEHIIDGVQKFKTLEDIVRLITTNMWYCNDNDKHFDEFKYDVCKFKGHPQYGCTCQEYMNWMDNNSDIVIQDVTINPKKVNNDELAVESVNLFQEGLFNFGKPKEPVDVMGKLSETFGELSEAQKEIITSTNKLSPYMPFFVKYGKQLYDSIRPSSSWLDPFLTKEKSILESVNVPDGVVPVGRIDIIINIDRLISAYENYEDGVIDNDEYYTKLMDDPEEDLAYVRVYADKDGKIYSCLSQDGKYTLIANSFDEFVSKYEKNEYRFKLNKNEYTVSRRYNSRTGIDVFSEGRGDAEYSTTYKIESDDISTVGLFYNRFIDASTACTFNPEAAGDDEPTDFPVTYDSERRVEDDCIKHGLDEPFYPKMKVIKLIFHKAELDEHFSPNSNLTYVFALNESLDKPFMTVDVKNGEVTDIKFNDSTIKEYVDPEEYDETLHDHIADEDDVYNEASVLKFPKKVNNVPFDIMYFGSNIDFGNESIKLDHNELFLTPYIGLASIFITDRKEYFKPLPKDRPHNTNIGYDEWGLSPSELQKPLKEVHVSLDDIPNVTPFEFDYTGYIYAIDVSQYKNNLYQKDWMTSDREFILKDINPVPIKEKIKWTHHVYVRGGKNTDGVFNESWTDFKNGVHPSSGLMFHVSLKNDMDGKTINPQLPSYITDGGKLDDNYQEDTKTKRLCVSPSIEGCLIAILNYNKIREHVGDKFYVYTPEKPFSQYKHKTNKEIVKDKLVFDANITKEAWILEPCKLKLYGIIKLKKVNDLKKKPTVEKNIKMNTIKLDYEWIMTPKASGKFNKAIGDSPDKEDTKEKLIKEYDNILVPNEEFFMEANKNLVKSLKILDYDPKTKTIKCDIPGYDGKPIKRVIFLIDDYISQEKGDGSVGSVASKKELLEKYRSKTSDPKKLKAIDVDIDYLNTRNDNEWAISIPRKILKTRNLQNLITVNHEMGHIYCNETTSDDEWKEMQRWQRTRDEYDDIDRSVKNADHAISTEELYADTYAADKVSANALQKTDEKIFKKFKQDMYGYIKKAKVKQQKILNRLKSLPNKLTEEEEFEIKKQARDLVVEIRKLHKPGLPDSQQDPKALAMFKEVLKLEEKLNRSKDLPFEKNMIETDLYHIGDALDRYASAIKNLNIEHLTHQAYANKKDRIKFESCMLDSNEEFFMEAFKSDMRRKQNESDRVSNVNSLNNFKSIFKDYESIFGHESKFCHSFYAPENINPNIIKTKKFNINLYTEAYKYLIDLFMKLKNALKQNDVVHSKSLRDKICELTIGTSKSQNALSIGNSEEKISITMMPKSYRKIDTSKYHLFVHRSDNGNLSSLKPSLGKVYDDNNIFMYRSSVVYLFAFEKTDDPGKKKKQFNNFDGFAASSYGNYIYEYKPKPTDVFYIDEHIFERLFKGDRSYIPVNIETKNPLHVTRISVDQVREQLFGNNKITTESSSVLISNDEFFDLMK